MEWISEFFQKLRHLEDLIQWGGLAVLVGIVFAETGLLIGFFLPGDSLLFAAGALVGSGMLRAPVPLPQDPVTGILTLNALLMAAAIIGDSTGYWFGKKTGPALFSRSDSRFFKRKYLLKAQELYEKQGGFILILARWMPFVRTFAPIVAGVAQMPYGRFMTYNVVGGVTWVFSMTMLGYLLGNVPFFKQHNEKVIIAIILISVAPPFLHYLKERRKPAEPPPAPASAD